LVRGRAWLWSTLSGNGSYCWSLDIRNRLYINRRLCCTARSHKLINGTTKLRAFTGIAWARGATKDACDRAAKATTNHSRRRGRFTILSHSFRAKDI
jgi:hypothetical protein